MATSSIDQIISRLWRPMEDRLPLRVYALVDAARDESIYPKIMASGLESASLHRGEKARELAWVAPYLVELQRGNSFTKWLLENGWGKSWGIFVESPATFNEIKRHFRTFMIVYDEERNSFFFRYYDPRVFRIYLPTCNANELEIIYGPVSRYHLEGKEENQLIEYVCAEDFMLVKNVVNT